MTSVIRQLIVWEVDTLMHLNCHFPRFRTSRLGVAAVATKVCARIDFFCCDGYMYACQQQQQREMMNDEIV